MIFDKILKFRYIQNTSILVGDIVRFNIWNNRFSPSLYRIIRQKPFHYFNKDLMENFFSKKQSKYLQFVRECIHLLSK